MSGFPIQTKSIAQVEARQKRKLIDVDVVRKLAGQGLCAAAIGAAIGQSGEAVRKFARRRGIQIAPEHRLDIDAVRRLADEGKTRRDIAAILGFDAEYLGRRARKAGIAIIREPCPAGAYDGYDLSPFWAANRVRLEQLIAEGKTASEVAAELGTTKNAVVSRACRWGLKWLRSPAKPVRVPLEFPPAGCCVYPLGEMLKPPTGWCGKPVRNIGEPYCCEHHNIAYRPPLFPNDRVMDVEGMPNSIGFYDV